MSAGGQYGSETNTDTGWINESRRHETTCKRTLNVISAHVACFLFPVTLSHYWKIISCYSGGGSSDMFLQVALSSVFKL